MLTIPDDYDPRLGAPIIPVTNDRMKEIIDSQYDPILNLAIQNLATINMSVDYHRCTECHKMGRGLSSVQDMSFTCRDCLLKQEMNRLHSDPVVERGYRVWKLRKAKKDHEMKSKIVVKQTYKASMDDLGTVSEFKEFIRAEHERIRRKP
ncbi:hypothetical protein [Ruminobacter sp.]|uniref:hypothetical protein n=1 Tax=Ruminobacter sp. TaxID=2774296 RepID=UPI00386C8017